mmetsp:Transcript_105685/g.187946  ORF Transcript_105685/g.187946 Transcript_105685/m.187946 type:complete len:244 (-) Transcript_105685:2-733(-)
MIWLHDLLFGGAHHHFDALPSHWGHATSFNAVPDSQQIEQLQQPSVASMSDAQKVEAASAATAGVHKMTIPSADPNDWGSHAWTMLHCMARHLPAQIPPEQQKSFQDLIMSLPQLLPCKMCGNNMRRHLLENPLDSHLATRKEVELWLIHLHNQVNKELGKPLLSDADGLRAADAACNAPAQEAASCTACMQQTPYQAGIGEAGGVAVILAQRAKDRAKNLKDRILRRRSLLEMKSFFPDARI